MSENGTIKKICTKCNEEKDESCFKLDKRIKREDKHVSIETGILRKKQGADF